MTARARILSLWALVVVVAGMGAAWVYLIEPRLNRTVADTLGQGDYELVMTGGGAFTEDTLREALDPMSMTEPHE